MAFLSDAAKPSVVVTAEDLARIGTRVPAFYEGDLFCPAGKTPLYLGQPIALLIFETFDAFDRAQLELRGKNVLKFGAETGPVAEPNYAAYRFTRVAGPTPDAPDIYAPIQEGWISPGNLKLPGVRSGSRSRSRRGRPTPRARPTARKSGRCSPRRIRPC